MREGYGIKRKKTRIYGTIRTFLWVLFGVLFCQGTVHAQFCMEGTELTDRVESYYSIGSGSTQGMCIAGDYLVETRWSSNVSQTIYEVIDMESGETVSSCTQATGHSNSLAYNPDRNEVVCVSDGTVYFFDFDAESGKISYRSSKTFEEHLVKVCYVSREGKYYVSTGIRMFSTSNFSSLTLCFETEEKGVNQGMGSDGKNLYICWFSANENTIEEISTSGSAIKTYVIDDTVCDEVEEVDFYKGDMYANVANSQENGVYRIPASHSYGDWKVTKKANCSRTGTKERTCSVCGNVEEAVIPYNNKHKKGKWKKKEPTCEEAGYERQICKRCGEVIMEVTLEPLGHNYSAWKTLKQENIYRDGLYKRGCVRCGKVEYEKREALKPSLTLSESKIEITCFKKYRLSGEVKRGDRIVSWESSNSLVAAVEDGVVTGRLPGKATIRATTRSGVTETCLVYVKIN